MKNPYESYALGLRLSHAALLRNLDRFIELAATREGIDEAGDLAAFVALYVEFLDVHHRSEDDHVFPALRLHSSLRTTDAAHLDRWSAEHREINLLGRELAGVAERLPRREPALKDLGRASVALKDLLQRHTAAEEEILSPKHLPEMLSAQELKAATESIARANRSRAIAMASFFASSLDPGEQQALLGDAPWIFRKFFLGFVGARRMRRFRPFVHTPSIAV